MGVDRGKRGKTVETALQTAIFLCPCRLFSRRYVGLV
jgi:hypothetical protein